MTRIISDQIALRSVQLPFLNNRVFLSRNYRLIVAPEEIWCSYNKYLPEKRSFEDKYACFKNIKFPRGNYQTHGSET